MELIMFVGIPASGKSTLSDAYREQGYLILSSDEIRNTMLQGAALESLPEKARAGVHSRVYEVIRKRAAEALKQGRSVVVDATNLSRKRRMTFLKQFSRFQCGKKCVLLITPPQICMERNRRRTGGARVPDEGMYHMLCNFECPNLWEGWDEIIPAADPAAYRFPFEEIEGFDQDNPHHTRTLDGHLAAAVQYLKDQGCGEWMQRVGQYHDIGKLYTQGYRSARGEPSQFAHYYGHENYSAYLYLAEMCCGKALTAEEVKQILYETSLINCHMRPLTLWRWSEGAEERDRQLFGEAFIADLLDLHRADRAAH